MRLGSFPTWSRRLALTSALACGWGSLALAADSDITPPSVTTPVLDPLAPSSLLSGPSLRETGRVGVMPEATASADALTPAETTWSKDSEKSVQPVAVGFADAPPPRPPVGIINPMLLEREVAANMSQVADCPIEVARSRQISPAQVAAQPLLLRWTIEPSGDARTVAVVPTGSTDPGVITCARAAMSQWRFTPPRGGSVNVERTVSFRNL